VIKLGFLAGKRHSFGYSFLYALLHLDNKLHMVGVCGFCSRKFNLRVPMTGYPTRQVCIFVWTVGYWPANFCLLTMFVAWPGWYFHQWVWHYKHHQIDLHLNLLFLKGVLWTVYFYGHRNRQSSRCRMQMMVYQWHRWWWRSVGCNYMTNYHRAKFLIVIVLCRKDIETSVQIYWCLHCVSSNWNSLRFHDWMTTRCKFVKNLL